MTRAELDEALKGLGASPEVIASMEVDPAIIAALGISAEELDALQLGGGPARYRRRRFPAAMMKRIKRKKTDP